MLIKCLQVTKPKPKPQSRTHTLDAALLLLNCILWQNTQTHKQQKSIIVKTFFFFSFWVKRSEKEVCARPVNSSSLCLLRSQGTRANKRRQIWSRRQTDSKNISVFDTRGGG